MGSGGSGNGITSMVLVVMAISSLMSMFFLLQIDGIIHEDLYRYGLQFSNEWAVPYWTKATIIFAVGWSNIVSAIALQLHILISKRREARITRPYQHKVLDKISQKQTQEEQSMRSTGSIPPSARAVEVIGLTDAEELIYDGADLYFHPDTQGRSFKTDFPDRKFKQSELTKLYREKRIDKDEYVERLIKAFPSRLEEDVSKKILEYLEDWLERMNNTEDSLAIVKECRQNSEKWNVLWKKICRRYEKELQQEALAA